MFESLKKIIQNIQAADEAKKRLWLYILSAIAMILVISGWVVCLNKTIVSLNPEKTTTEATEPANPTETQEPKESPLKVFMTGLKTITGQIKELITTTREISVENNFNQTTNPIEIPNTDLTTSSTDEQGIKESNN